MHAHQIGYGSCCMTGYMAGSNMAGEWVVADADDVTQDRSVSRQESSAPRGAVSGGNMELSTSRGDEMPCVVT